MENWGVAALGAGIALSTLIVAIFSLRRASDRDFMAQQAAHIASLEKENDRKDRRIDYLEERLREMADTMARRSSDMLDKMLEEATIHKTPKPNGDTNGGTH